METHLVKLIHDEKGNLIMIKVGDTIFSKDGTTKEDSDITADTITGIAQDLGSHTNITAKDVAESMLQITAGTLTKEQLLP
ncbi:hypothetical protein [Bacillus sp. Fil]|uniref:hypothetical protein n=1 Tax=Bacillus sp. Fil TaxID=3459567 RepID=UPI00403B2243